MFLKFTVALDTDERPQQKILNFKIDDADEYFTIKKALKSTEVRPRERILNPPPPPLLSILYMTNFFFQQISIFGVRLGPLVFLGRALRLGQARGPGAAAT